MGANSWKGILYGTEVSSEVIVAMEIGGKNNSYILFSCDDRGKLYSHRLDMNMNSGLGGIPIIKGFPQINIIGLPI